MQKINMGHGISIMKHMKSCDDSKKKQLVDICKELLDYRKNNIENQAETLWKLNSLILTDIKSAIKTNPFKSLKDQEADTSAFTPELYGTNFIYVLFNTYDMIDSFYKLVINSAKNSIPQDLLLSSDVENKQSAQTTKDIQNYLVEFQLNEGAINSYVSAINSITESISILNSNLEKLYNIHSNYYLFLKDKHTTKGAKVFDSPIMTDIAHSIFANVDAHGEIESGTKADQISAYTINKAINLITSIKNDTIYHAATNSDEYLETITNPISFIINKLNQLKEILSSDIALLNKVKESDFMQVLSERLNNANTNNILARFADINPHSVRAKSDVFISQDEKFSLEFEEETISTIVQMLDISPPKDILDYILSRKEKLKKHFHEENTFYVCQISQGNPFLGEAPGALKVIPGKRPRIEFDHILGSGFEEIKNFYFASEASIKWSPLFIATSPSKSADKSNCLMIGPGGCGKSEILRAVGGHKDCIGVFAQGSDFLTCWKGEAEKNPKRLFEQALKLHSDSKKRVYILIDEIDAVIHKPEGYNDTNLTLEFQILMDGIVSYPGISVWGATNHPERIPMPMIRRFSKVEIVGELDYSHRKSLFKNFLSGIPTYGISDDDWQKSAEMTDGATGDVIRQICDHIWRDKIYTFIKNKPNDAVKVMDKLLEIQDGKFDVHSLKESEKASFKETLGGYVRISNEDLHGTISKHLKNIAIQSEIEAAKTTYAAAKKLLRKIEEEQT